ncbi:MAG TPA: S4 domain-containing protein [Dermatophilaceae bacterium]|nr:S4 domain-containing protein [Dermatophilaceae bacterium]
MLAADSVRVDTWLWAVRVYKSRSAATTACRSGHVKVGDVRAKAATLVRPGQRVTVTGGPHLRILVVSHALTRRVSAPLAAQAFRDESPPPPPRQDRPAATFARDRGTGRPTKRDRRRLDRLRGSETSVT